MFRKSFVSWGEELGFSHYGPGGEVSLVDENNCSSVLSIEMRRDYLGHKSLTLLNQISITVFGFFMELRIGRS